MRHRKVVSVMTPAAAVVSVGVGAGYKEIARLLVEYRVSALPVLDARQRVVGVVSEADLMQKEVRAEPVRTTRFPRRDEGLDGIKAAGTTALDLMTSPAVTIGPDEDVVRAARMMAEHHVKRLPVVDADGRLAGVVSRRDIVGVFVRPDEEIRVELIDDVIVGALWADPGPLTIEVEDGVVTLRGTVETRSLAGLIGTLARRVDGVVAVDNRLDYERDDSLDKLPESPFHGVFHRRRAG